MTEGTTESEIDPAPLLAIMGRFYPFDDSGIPFARKMLVIKEMQNRSDRGEDGGTGLNVWDGSLLLARYLEKRPGIVRNKAVLELGSGCGLVGIACAILGAKSVVMTDLQYALPLMKGNVKRYESSLDGDGLSRQRIKCKECDWFRPPPMDELFGDPGGDARPDVILVADCVWISRLIRPLLQTLEKYTAHASAKVIITYQQRGIEAHEEFWEGLCDIFDTVPVDTEKSVGLHKPDVFHVLECSKKSGD